MSVLVENRRQALKVRLILWGSIVAAALAVWAGWSIHESFGLSPGDGGVLRPLWERAAFGTGVAALGLVFAAGMLLYASLYVLHLEVEGDRVEIATMTPWGRRSRRFAVAEIGGSARHPGRMDLNPRIGGGATPRVNAPWLTLRVRGRRLPFIIDLQAERVEVGELSALAG